LLAGVRCKCFVVVRTEVETPQMRMTRPSGDREEKTVISGVSKAITIGDLRLMAQKRTPEFAFVPVEIGGGDGSGPARNAEAFRKYHFSAEALVDAVIASNHGGNKLDSIAAAIDILPGIAMKVGARAPVLFDGGIRRGSNILVALGLGAGFCMVARATLYGVMAGGTAGALRAIEILRSEIERDLKMIGCPNVAQMGPSFLHPPL
jgi:isopentenyl diphosphate isomerase/L-lactate dehydrogenase-like FMN-dependent dehydrogenase